MSASVDSAPRSVSPSPAIRGWPLRRWPMTNSSGPLQFWRLFRRRGQGRTHGRLLVDGNSYWK